MNCRICQSGLDGSWNLPQPCGGWDEQKEEECPFFRLVPSEAEAEREMQYRRRRPTDLRSRYRTQMARLHW